MTTIASADLQARFSELLDRVARGESIAITEAGKPVAHLVPPTVVGTSVEPATDQPSSPITDPTPPSAEGGRMVRGEGEPNLEKPDARKVIEEMIAYRDKQKRTLGDLTFRDLIDEGRRY